MNTGGIHTVQRERELYQQQKEQQAKFLCACRSHGNLENKGA